MKKIKMYSLILGLLSILNQPLMAHNEKEEIKEKTEKIKVPKAERPLVTSFFGGMMLTKIILESQTSLVPYAYTDDADYAERCESLIGLVIFHTADKKDNKANKDKKAKAMPSGMYVWDGEQWQKSSF